MALTVQDQNMLAELSQMSFSYLITLKKLWENDANPEIQKRLSLLNQVVAERQSGKAPADTVLVQPKGIPIVKSPVEEKIYTPEKSSTIITPTGIFAGNTQATAVQVTAYNGGFKGTTPILIADEPKEIALPLPPEKKPPVEVIPEIITGNGSFKGGMNLPDTKPLDFNPTPPTIVSTGGTSTYIEPSEKIEEIKTVKTGDDNLFKYILIIAGIFFGITLLKSN